MNRPTQRALVWCGLVAALLLGIALATQDKRELKSQPPERARSDYTLKPVAPHGAAAPAPGGPSLAATFAADEVAAGRGLKEQDQAVRKQIASRETPEFQRQIVDAVVAKNRPHYDKLFEQWQTAPASREQVVSIVRERELKLRSLLMRRFAGELDSSQYKAMKTSERESARLELSNALSAEQVTAFLQMDEGLAAERGKAFRAASPGIPANAAQRE